MADDLSVTLVRGLGRAVVGGVLVLFIGGCGGEGSGLRPALPTAAEAIDDDAPLTIDWPAGKRADLEAASTRSVAVVEVNKDGIALLDDCELPGSYGFIGVTPKEQIIHLDDAREVAVNLPVGGPALTAQIGVELGQSSSLDLALVIVGKRTTARRFAPRALLKGRDCKRATHFVRGMSVGAFAMKSSARGSASTVAGLFGVGLSASASSAKSVHQVDGRLDACRTSTTGADAPPDGCGALLRLDLKPIDEPEHVTRASCGGDLVRAAGKCARAQAEVAFECKPDDQTQCREQCERGDGASCAHLVRALRRSFDKKPDFRDIKRLAERGCQLGSLRACVQSAELYHHGNGVSVSYEKAAKVYQAACEAGEPSGCFQLGVLVDLRPGLRRALSRARKLYDRACRGGSEAGCNNLARLLMRGNGGPKNQEGAAELYEKACKNGSAAACGNLGDLHVSAKGVARDVGRGLELWDEACKRSGSFCLRLGDAYSEGRFAPAAPARAAAAYASARRVLTAQCDRGNWRRCTELAWLLHEGKSGRPDDKKAARLLAAACSAGEPAACADHGLFQEHGWGTPVDLDKARLRYQKACAMGNTQGCTNLALKERGARRVQILEDACDRESPLACFQRGRDLRIAGGRGSKHARQFVIRGCEGDLGMACTYLGRWERSGSGLQGLAGLGSPAQKRVSAVKRFRQACDLGHGPGCGELSQILERRARTGRGQAARKYAEAAGYAELACNLASGSGCRLLATLAEAGHAASVQPADITPLLQRACRLGDLSGCAGAGTRLMASSSDADVGEAAKLLERACDPEAVKNVRLEKPPKIRDPKTRRAGVIRIGDGVAAMLGVGGGSSPDIGALLGVAMDGAEADVRDMGAEPVAARQLGCLPLAETLYSGPERLRDRERALLLANVACKGGRGAGCTFLGQRHAGSGDKTRRAKALDLYRQGCSRGSRLGCFEAAKIFEKSAREGERLAAVELYAKSCSKALPEACAKAARRKQRRRDAPEKSDALRLFERGCEYGDAKACSDGARLAKRGWKNRKPDRTRAGRLRDSACKLGRKQDCRR